MQVPYEGNCGGRLLNQFTVTVVVQWTPAVTAAPNAPSLSRFSRGNRPPWMSMDDEDMDEEDDYESMNAPRENYESASKRTNVIAGSWPIIGRSSNMGDKVDIMLM
jgi:hypothetical protein